jgi:hypothetical protein
MALSAKVVSFLLSDDVVGTTQAITGVGFQPKALIFFSGGSVSATDLVTDTLNTRIGAGFASGATKRGCITYFVNDAEATMDTSCGIRGDAAFAVTDGADVFVGAWDLVSLDADGFTIVVDIDAATASATRVHVLCLGGDDITNVETNSFTKAAATGNQAVTGVGFQPDMVFFLTTGEAGPLPDSDSAARYSLGAARSSSQQVVLHAFSEDAIAASNTDRYSRFDECVLARINGTFANQRGSLVSLDADGFTINWLEGTTAIPVLYLAIKGGGWHIGNSATATSLTTVATSGYGFTPKGVMVLSHCRTAQNTAGVMAVDMTLSVGAADSPTSRGCHSNFEFDASGTSNIFQGISYDEVYQNLTGGGGMVGEMDLQSLDADGVTFVMDDADPTARVFGYIGFGDTPAAAGGPTVNSLMLMGVGI